MHPNEILSFPANRLNQSQRELFYEQGYLAMPGLFSPAEIEPLRIAMNAAIELSREMTESSNQFDLESGHSAENPRLRRIAYMDDLDDACWAFCKSSTMVDMAADILGPNVRFRDAMINFKWSGGGAEVKWHQDTAFYPHTNTGTCQFLLALDDVGPSQGPLQLIPGSHKGPIYEHYDAEDNWTGAIPDADLSDAGIDNAVEVTGCAGTISVHHSCTIHGSARNMSSMGRPMLIISYSAADAIPYTAAPYPSSHYGALVRGIMPPHAHHQELQMPLPPDWSGGYTSIFAHQEEDA